MDWKTLSDLQQELIDQKIVIMVSSVAIFWYKMIETGQGTLLCSEERWQFTQKIRLHTKERPMWA